MKANVFIFHGTEGYPEENWFPWMKEKLEAEGCKVVVPQFPSPPVVPAKISEWFDVLKKLRQNEWGKHVPVIILTNLSSPEGISKSLEFIDGFHEYLVKSDWKIEDVVVKVRERLGK